MRQAGSSKEGIHFPQITTSYFGLWASHPRPRLLIKRKLNREFSFCPINPHRISENNKIKDWELCKYKLRE